MDSSKKLSSAEPSESEAFASAFFDELHRAGVEHVCVSPGSRSTPLAVAAQRSALRCWSQIDERSAAFFALGLAKHSNKPVALVCTSGTAAANYLPAVVESHYAEVPLLVLTADRPPELREWGAGQTIDQIGLYSGAVRWFVELPTMGGAVVSDEERAEGERYSRTLACRAVSKAQGAMRGPVHLNWPLREPLEPRAAAPALRERATPATPSVVVSRELPAPSESQVDSIVQLASNFERGVVICGPEWRGEEASRELAQAVCEFARAAGWPVIADPTSQLRAGPHLAAAECAAGPVLASADLLLRSEHFAAAHAPQAVVKLGGSPVSKSLRLWLEKHRPAAFAAIDPSGGWNEPSRVATQVLRCDAAPLLRSAATRVSATRSKPCDSAWLADWCDADRRAGQAVGQRIDEADALFEAVAVADLCAVLPDASTLYVSNSMPIRYLDAVLPASSQSLSILANRGANGIDGVTSSALGAAAGTRAPVVLLTGDLAFLHDLSGLVTVARYRNVFEKLVIVVLNNDGGGIFSHLPIAAHAESVGFEEHFSTPHGLALARTAELFGFAVARVESRAHFAAELKNAFSSLGPSLIEVVSDRDASVAQFRSLVAAAVSAVLDDEGVK